jgi:hypothetical protein
MTVHASILETVRQGSILEGKHFLIFQIIDKCKYCECKIQLTSCQCRVIAALLYIDRQAERQSNFLKHYVIFDQHHTFYCLCFSNVCVCVRPGGGCFFLHFLSHNTCFIHISPS